MSYLKTWNFRVDAVKQYLGEVINVIKQETYANKFTINCTNNGYPIDLTDLAYASVTFTKSDNFTVVATANATDAVHGRVEVLVDYQAIAALGICNVSVTLFFNDASVITLNNFPINVTLDPYAGTNGSVASTSEYPILQDIIVDANVLNAALNGAEAVRIASENTRISNESERQSIELTRQGNEATRIIDEDDRISEESIRQNNEADRILAESSRVISEATRESQEDVRISGEIYRVNNEIDRELIEIIRLSNEDIRISNENDRIATEAVRTQFLHKGEYNGSVNYLKNNIVLHNNESFLCLQDAIGIETANNSYWGKLVDLDGVEVKLNALETTLSASNTRMDAHVAGTAEKHVASKVTFSPTPTISDTDVQKAIEKVDQRVENIILSDGASDAEVVDARNSSRYGIFGSLKARSDAHENANMPHILFNAKDGKYYKYGEQVSVDGKPQLIFEEVL